MKEVRWTKVAVKSLQETSDFILENWNSNINEEFIKQLDYRISQLQKNPDLGPSFENTQIRKLVIHKSSSLFYINTSNFIKLLLIWDNRQDPNRLIDKLTNAN